MAVRDLIPWGRSRSAVPSPMPGEEVSPFLTLHREMNRLFDDVFNRFESGIPSLLGRMPGGAGGAWAGSWPSLEVTASDTDVRVSAELPGMDEKDVEVLVDNDVLTIRGEKKSESEDQGRRFSERYYGRFERSMALPFEVDEAKAEASFKNGVLTVTLPKSATAKDTAKRIAINAPADTKH
jgi:HSP20 family protein